MAYKTKLSNNFRNAVAARLDKYAKFTWCGIDMWNEYGAFIINEKRGGLKFYNGPSFSNTYTSPQFSRERSDLVEVTYKTQSISFKIGVYGVTEDEFRQLMYCLHPLEVNYLSFGFQPDWRYLVKLSSRADSDRYIIGCNDDQEDLYYTEFDLKFEVQGDSVAIRTSAMNTVEDGGVHERTITIKDEINTTGLNTPFDLTFRCATKGGAQSKVAIKLKWEIDNQPYSKNLALITFTNATSQSLLLRYESSSGNVYLIDGEIETTALLNLLTTYSSGKRIIQAIKTFPSYIPGKLENSGTISNIRVVISSETCDIDLGTGSKTEGLGLTCYGRTNLI
jgi:hypothetical protein